MTKPTANCSIEPQRICLPPSWRFESCSAQAPCLTQPDSAPASTWLYTLFVSTSAPHTLVCAVICAGSQCLTQLKCGVFENISMHGQGGGVFYSYDTHTAWKADQITCKHFNSCIGYTKRGRSAQSQVKVFSPCIVVRFQIHVQFYTLTKALTYQHIYSHCNIPEGNDSPTKKGILNWVEDPRHWSPIVTYIWARMPHKLQRAVHVLQAFSLTRSTSDLNTLVISWFRLRYR